MQVFLRRAPCQSEAVLRLNERRFIECQPKCSLPAARGGAAGWQGRMLKAALGKVSSWPIAASARRKLSDHSSRCGSWEWKAAELTIHKQTSVSLGEVLGDLTLMASAIGCKGDLAPIKCGSCRTCALEIHEQDRSFTAILKGECKFIVRGSFRQGTGPRRVRRPRESNGVLVRRSGSLSGHQT